jgi:hypothetical protein
MKIDSEEANGFEDDAPAGGGPDLNSLLLFGRPEEEEGGDPEGPGAEYKDGSDDRVHCHIV